MAGKHTIHWLSGEYTIDFDTNVADGDAVHVESVIETFHSTEEMIKTFSRWRLRGIRIVYGDDLDSNDSAFDEALEIFDRFVQSRSYPERSDNE